MLRYLHIVNADNDYRLPVCNARMGYQARQGGQPAVFELIGLRLGLLAGAGTPHQVDFYMVAQALMTVLKISGPHFANRYDFEADDFGKVVQHGLFDQLDIRIRLTGYSRQCQW